MGGEVDDFSGQGKGGCNVCAVGEGDDDFDLGTPGPGSLLSDAVFQIAVG